MNDEKYLKTWNVYQSAWAPIGEAERRNLLRQSVSDDIVYTDPASKVHGMEALAERIGKSQEQFPGRPLSQRQLPRASRPRPLPVDDAYRRGCRSLEGV